MVCEESSFCLVGDFAENSPLAGHFSRRHLSLRKEKRKKKKKACQQNKANEHRISQAQQGCSLTQAQETLLRHFHTNREHECQQEFARQNPCIVHGLSHWHYDSFPVLNLSLGLDTTTPFLY